MTPLNAMRCALEALDIYEYQGTDTDAEKVTRAITNLRTAIAELAKAEPVAWMHNQVTSWVVSAVNVEDAGDSWTPLFTHPVQSRASIIEECAAVCEEVHSRYPTDIFPEGQSVTAQSAKMARITANNCALEIRALKGK